MIHHRLLLAWLVGCAVACQPTKPAPLTQADEAAIKAGDAAFAKAATAGDLPGIMALYADEAVVLPPAMPMAQGKTAIEELFGGMMQQMSVQLELTPKIIEGAGDRATVVGIYRLVGTPKGSTAMPPEDGKYVLALQRQADGSWKLTRDAWSPDAPPPAPPAPAPAPKK
jgi:uncharacterized protein (TIGR02246 family)